MLRHWWFVDRVSIPFHYGSMMSVSRFVQAESLLARSVFGVYVPISGGTEGGNYRFSYCKTIPRRFLGYRQIVLLTGIAKIDFEMQCGGNDNQILHGTIRRGFASAFGASPTLPRY